MLSNNEPIFNIKITEINKEDKIKRKYDNLIDEYYKEINTKESYEYRCPNCHKKSCIKHSYYTRTIKIGPIIMDIRILRIKCTECGKTHAIIPMFIVPYKRIPRDIIIVLLKATNKEIKDLNYINEDSILLMRSKFKKIFLKRFNKSIHQVFDYYESLLESFAYECKMHILQTHLGQFFLFS